MRAIVLSVYICVAILSACKPVSMVSTSSGGKYSEDLSAWRPSVAVVNDDSTMHQQSGTRDIKGYTEAQHTVNAPLETVLDSIDRINLTRRFIDGFTIQIYMGTNRELALNTKKELITSSLNLESELEYIQPNFRVKTGHYFNTLDAQKDYMAIKRYFPNAIVIPDRIPIK